MSEVVPFKRPLHWNNPRTDQLEDLVRSRAKETSNVIIYDHAFDRLDERGVITQLDVYEILQKGAVIPGSLERDKKIKGAWKFQVMQRIRGGRDAIAVTVAAKNDNMLHVVTVMWRDL